MTSSVYLYCVNCQLPLFVTKVRAVNSLRLYHHIEEVCACVMPAEQILYRHQNTSYGCYFHGLLIGCCTFIVRKKKLFMENLNVWGNVT